MTQHTHREHVEGCFRCELSRDEVVAASGCDCGCHNGTVKHAAPCRCERPSSRLDRTKH